ncbi:PEP-utilizing enzyme [Phytophthora infestans]|uniref:pyruvate, phosphate dikinase n=1 Tax=Phytophthora infestans TaxID=4787 RepID=A0A833T0D1_PHYIN|nr:PEP-utilizing enzyme [Phytophthora infestans]
MVMGGRLPNGLMNEVHNGVRLMEKALGVTFADVTNPLLVSVRSGAAISMPGMMDTVLNLGLNDEIVEGVAKRGGDRFAYDCYRRLLQMFGDVVLEIPHDDFEAELSAMKQERHVTFDVELTASDLKELVQTYKKVYEKHGKSFPSDPWEQMRMGIEAVFRSWNIPRAVKYREINKITGLKGTAVNVQAMVYGNINDQSCTGVLFTRNPANGENKLYGEFLLNAQGEDVVAGIRTPQPISELAEKMPVVYKELDETVHNLETHFKDIQDTEFTVQDGVLFMLQTRNGKRTGPAALKIAVDMWREKLITEEEAVMLVEPRHLDQLLHPSFANEKAYQKDVLCRGLPASPGAAVGKIVFTAADAEAWFARGENVMLVREETSPEDVGGMHAAEGILTSRGGMTSHAAVVARGWGKPCVCGCSALSIDANTKTMRVSTADGAEVVLREGDYISMNGTTGEVVLGKQELQKAVMSGELEQFMKWVDAHRRMEVFTNADTPEDVARPGIGLTRTEHMFFSSAQRIAAVRRMIGAVELDSPAQQEALDALCTFQKSDFEGIFRAMDGLPVTIRMLDPPLHEFLPHEGSALDELCATLAQEMTVSKKTVESRLASLKEANPMMGLRGCRLGIVHPGITEMQAKAIAEAAVTMVGEGIAVHPHIMIPLVGSIEELEQQVKLVRSVVQDVIDKHGKSFDYKAGTMIEVPRGALQAGRLAEVAEFFSFGTNDLTQMTSSRTS